MVTIPKTVGNVGDMLSKTLTQKKVENGRVLLKYIQRRQGIAFRGHDDSENLYLISHFCVCLS